MAAEDLIFTVALLFGTGTFFYHNLSKLNVPYTVLMFIYGMVIGAFGFVLPEEYTSYFDLLADIPPELIFHIFLPILIFEGAYGMKIHAFRQVFWQVVLLANPGLVINIIFVAVSLKWVLFPDWNWFTAMLLGALLSATDPVAVVALLKDLGVDKRITAMVDGEAIMNDGTAIIAFTIFLPAAAVGFIEGTWDQIVFQSLRLTLGAVAFGGLCGWIQAFCLRRANNSIVQTCITISGAYMSFFLADVVLKTSGVLTLCFQGVYLSYNYPSLFPGKEGSMLNSTWHFLVHFANTIIFALVGIIIVRDVLVDFTWIDLGYIIFLYVTLVLARGVMIVMLSPFLNRFSFKIRLNDIGLLVHGGLRGAVAMTLALIVAREDKIPREIGINFLELTTGIVIITTVVNASTSGYVMEKLGHKSKEMNRMVQMDIGHKYVQNEADRAIRQAKTTTFFKNANFNMISALIRDIHNPYRDMRCVAESEEVIFNTLLMRAFKTTVWLLRDSNKISEDVVKVLTTVAANNLRKGTLINTDQLRPHMQYPFFVDKMESINGWFAEQARMMRIRYDEEFYGYLVAYNSALDGVEEVLSTYVTTQQQLTTAHEWLSEEREAVVNKIQFFAEDKPRAATAVITKIAGTSVFQNIMESVEHLHHHKGFAVPAEEALLHEIEHAAELIHGWPGELEELDLETAIENSSLCNGLPTGTLNQIMSIGKVEHYSEDEEIRLERSIAVVVSGVARVLGRDDRELGNGAVFNVDEMLLNKHHVTKHYAASPIKVLAIPFDGLQKIAHDDAILQNKLLTLAAIETLEPQFSRLTSYTGWKYDHIIDMLEEGTVLIVPTENYKKSSSAQETVCFLKGSDNSGLVTASSAPFIVPSSVGIAWESNTLLFVVPTRFNEETFNDPVRRRAMSEMIAAGSSSVHMHNSDEEMTSAGGIPPGDASQLREALSTHGRIAIGAAPVPITYTPASCATCVPYFNRYQLEFVSHIEQLSGAAQEYINYRQTPARVALSKAIDSTLQFLLTFCVQHFTAEALFYQTLGYTGWAAHQAEHDVFHALVSTWVQKKTFDELCHDEIIAGMCNFVSHFERDAKDSEGIKAIWPQVATINNHLELPAPEELRDAQSKNAGSN